MSSTKSSSSLKSASDLPARLTTEVASMEDTKQDKDPELGNPSNNKQAEPLGGWKLVLLMTALSVVTFLLLLDQSILSTVSCSQL
jgi:hypothetical protein